MMSLDFPSTPCACVPDEEHDLPLIVGFSSRAPINRANSAKEAAPRLPSIDDFKSRRNVAEGLNLTSLLMMDPNPFVPILNDSYDDNQNQEQEQVFMTPSTLSNEAPRRRAHLRPKPLRPSEASCVAGISFAFKLPEKVMFPDIPSDTPSQDENENDEVAKKNSRKLASLEAADNQGRCKRTKTMSATLRRRRPTLAVRPTGGGLFFES